MAVQWSDTPHIHTSIIMCRYKYCRFFITQSVWVVSPFPAGNYPWAAKRHTIHALHVQRVAGTLTMCTNMGWSQALSNKSDPVLSGSETPEQQNLHTTSFCCTVVIILLTQQVCIYS